MFTQIRSIEEDNNTVGEGLERSLLINESVNLWPLSEG